MARPDLLASARKKLAAPCAVPDYAITVAHIADKPNGAIPLAMIPMVERLERFRLVRRTSAGVTLTDDGIDVLARAGPVPTSVWDLLKRAGALRP
jgi:hypothetical protein